MTRVLLICATLFFFACSSSGPVPPAPKPRRPKPNRTDKNAVTKTDCEPTDHDSLPPTTPYEERSIFESNNLTAEASTLFKRSKTAGLERVEAEDLTTEAVRTLITALAADPYNVHATYNLAAAYARIGRRQCSINLLERLVLLRKLPSQKPGVEAKLDLLLGKDRYKGHLDPDFADLRGDPAFRTLIKKFRGSL